MKVLEPVVSVLMGVSNGGNTLTDAVTSILDQTFQDLEFIICDDGSTDNTGAQLANIQAKDDRVRVITLKENGGLAPALNRCLAVARGAYIARMDADDFSQPDRLEKQLDFLETNPDVAFVGCVAHLRRGGEDAGLRIFPANPTVRDFYMTQPYLHPTLVFRRKALETVGGYSEDKRQVLCEDYDLLLRLYAKGFWGANLQEPLFTYTLPTTAKGNRRMIHRWNETVTRWRRFKELNVLPGALPWVVKPLAVGLMPEGVLEWLKRS